MAAAAAAAAAPGWTSRKGLARLAQIAGWLIGVPWFEGIIIVVAVADSVYVFVYVCVRA